MPEHGKLPFQITGQFSHPLEEFCCFTSCSASWPISRVSSSARIYHCCPHPDALICREEGFCYGTDPIPFFFFLISVEDGDLRRGIKDLVEGNQPWQRHIAHFYFCARALCWTLCCAPSWTWKPKSRCSEGLAKPWSELYFSWWDFPRSEPRLIGSKEKISQLLPTGLTLRGTEDFCPQC